MVDERQKKKKRQKYLVENMPDITNLESHTCSHQLSESAK